MRMEMGVIAPSRDVKTLPDIAESIFCPTEMSSSPPSLADSTVGTTKSSSPNLSWFCPPDRLRKDAIWSRAQCHDPIQYRSAGKGLAF